MKEAKANAFAAHSVALVFVCGLVYFFGKAFSLRTPDVRQSLQLIPDVSLYLIPDVKGEITRKKIVFIVARSFFC